MSQAFEEAFNLLCGEKLGAGISREVFACALLPGYVVKVETDRERFQNIIEWETWNIVQGTDASRWFAECKWISPNGKLLIQERTRPAGPLDYPERIPIWFTDTKRTNWGMARSKKKDGSDGREWLVCHDYGTSLMLQDGTTTKRTKKAEWYEA
jgi:hypothetical protein